MVNIRNTVVGGSDAFPVSEIVANILALALGGPDSGPLRIVFAGIISQIVKFLRSEWAVLQ